VREDTDFGAQGLRRAAFWKFMDIPNVSLCVCERLVELIELASAAIADVIEQRLRTAVYTHTPRNWDAA